MGLVEMILAVVGAVVLVISYVVPAGKAEKDAARAPEIDGNMIRDLVEREINGAKGHMNDMVDETLSYSCGYFLHEDDSLYQAQLNKVDYILKKLYLKEGMSLLDIGCGWGFLLIEAAKKYGVQGMGITLSQEQYKEFQRRIAEEHLEQLLTVKLMDYRDIIVHIFSKEDRLFYDLERIWTDGKSVEVSEL